MLDLQRALRQSLTLGQLIPSISWNIVSIVLFRMALFTEVSSSPAEPLSNVAAELALELYEISPMFGAVFNPSPHTLSRALSTNQLFRFEYLILVLLVLVGTILHPSKVRNLALEAHIVAELSHSIPLQVIAVNEVFSFESFMLV